MNIKKLISIGIISILILGLSACGNKVSESDNNGQTNNNQTQSNKPNQTDEPQNNSGESKNSPPAPATSQQTQQEVSSKIKAALNTKVPLMLPTNISVGEGHYLTATTVSQTWYYKANFYETERITDINSQTAAKGNLIVTVEGTEYKNGVSAKESINGYMKVDTSQSGGPILDLGHNIKAIQDAGVGHGYIIWNEGNWCISIDSPNDPAYKNGKYPDSKQLAKNVVEYLEAHMLPAPQNIGVININNWNKSNGTTIEWQYNQMVYKVWSQDPMTALKVAVAMKLNK